MVRVRFFALGEEVRDVRPAWTSAAEGKSRPERKSGWGVLEVGDPEDFSSEKKTMNHGWIRDIKSRVR